MNRHPRRRASTSALLAAMTAWTLLAGERALGTEEAPPLALGIPHDCLFYMHARANDRWEALSRGIGSVAQACVSSGLVDDVLKGLLRPSLDDPDAETLDAEAKSWREIIGAIDWRSLIARETAVGMRFEFPRYNLVVLFRVDPAERAELSKKLEFALEALAGLGDDLVVLRGARGGIENLVVRSRLEPNAELCLGGSSDVIALATSSQLLRQSVQLLEDRSRGWAIAIDEGYRAAFESLASRNDFAVLARPVLYFDQLRLVSDALENEAGNTPTARAATRIREGLGALIQGLDAVEWCGLSATCKGSVLSGDIRLVLGEQAERSVVYRALASVPALGANAGRLPARAGAIVSWSGFEASALVELAGKLWAGVVQGTSEDFRDLLEDWEESRGVAGAALRLVRRASGRVSLYRSPPGAGADEVTGGMALRLSLREGEETREAFEALVRSVDDAGLDLRDEGASLKSIAFPFLAAQRLSFGIRESGFVIGTSTDALDAVSGAAAKDRGAKSSLAARLEKHGIPVEAESQIIAALEFPSLLADIRAFLGAAALVDRLSPAKEKEGGAIAARLAAVVEACAFLEWAGLGIVRDGKRYRGHWSVEMAEPPKKDRAQRF